MPRQARLDAPGLFHHVMARGLNRETIFCDKSDYVDFLRRIPLAFKLAPNEIFAWALMPNHVHFLMRSGSKGIAPFFRRLFTGYAMSFNQRHRRIGYLFQNRYKSIVCDEEDYFLTLVRYIHLNPVVAQIVGSVQALASYPYTGHSSLMGQHPSAWQAVDEVLGRFGKKAGEARRDYVNFLTDGLPELREFPVDLLGAGLLESLRESMSGLDREDDRALLDSRVLGESEFIQEVYDQVDEQEHQTNVLKRQGIDVRRLAKHIARACRIPERSLFMRGRERIVSEAKAALIFVGVEHLNKTTREMAILTKMSGPAASKARGRGQVLLKKLGIKKLLS